MLIPSTILLIFFRINFTLNYKIYRLIFINKFDYLFDYLFENNFFSSCTIINIIALKEYYFFFYYRILLTQLPILLVKTGKKKQFIYKELALRVVCGGLFQFVAKGENVCASPCKSLWVLRKERTCVPRRRRKSRRKWTPAMPPRPCASLTLWGLPPPFPLTATRVASTTLSSEASSRSITSNVEEFHALLLPNHPSV